MIINLKISNFYSFAQDNNVSFAMGKKPRASHYDINIGAPNEIRLNKVLAVIGANGSGKTQLVRALPFLAWFITKSARDLNANDEIPFKPHALYDNAPTSFEIEFLLEQSRYRYRLVIKNDVVLHESLHEKTSAQFSYIFVRDKTESGYQYKEKSFFDFSTKQAKQVRQNISLLASAYMHDVQASAKFIQFFTKVAFNVNTIGRKPFKSSDVLECADFVYHKPDIREHIANLLCDMDLGLSNIEYHKKQMLQENGDKSVEVTLPYGVHQADNGEEFNLTFFLESSGTQSAYVLLSRLLPVLQEGGIAVIDELDNDLHPYMLPKILDLFKFKETNPYDAQLLFSCHAVEVLNELAKHQVYLVEKNDLISETWRLDEMEGLRADDNLYAKYLSGSLGAVPNL